jgi:biopolymer transport protein ExbD
MPKVKLPRKSTVIDMTAMCDVAFLLLTFFILTTKFRPTEVVEIDIPSSTAQIPIPDRDIMMIQISPEGQVFFGIDDQITRLKLLDRLEQGYSVKFTEDQKEAFKLVELWGMDIRELPKFLSLDANARAHFKQPGLVIDTTGGEHQLEDLILWSRQENNNLRIAIKADKTTEYKAFDKVIEALQNRKVNRFNLITSARGAQE